MQMNLTATIKGLITGAVMLATALGLFYSKQPVESNIQYLAYLVYAGGIAWTLISYSRSADYKNKFMDLFGQGFRCFIVVTLIMVAFTAIFTKMHPEFAKDGAQAYKEYLVKEKKDKLPAEVETEVKQYEEQYTMRLVSASIFGYLIMGAVFTAAISAVILLTRRKQ